jgi:hypothetical protein
MCLIYLLSSSFVAYFDKIRSPGLSTGVALRSICGVASDVGAYGVLLSASFGLAVCGGGGVLVGRLYGLAYVSAGDARDAAYCASGFGRSLHRSTLHFQ